MFREFNFVKTVVFALVTLACVGMWGCWKEDVEDVSWHRLIGYSGDSLAVYVVEKKEETCEHKPLGADCSTREKGTRIVVNNFYTGENVWKSSKIDDKYVVDVYDLVDDSTIVEFNKKDSKFYKWTLGKGYEKLGAFLWSGCYANENVKAIRPWGEGKWRLVGGNAECAYAIVDVENKEITGFKKLDEFAEGCSDLWMHEGVKYCVGLLEKDTIISYYERSLAGYFFRTELGVTDSLWNTEIDCLPLNHAPGIVYKNSFLYAGNYLFSVNYEKRKLNCLPKE